MSQNKKTIIIASSSFDEHTHGPVCERLRRRGFPVVIHLTDQIMAGKQRFQLEITESGELNVAYDDRPIRPSEVGAAWYWKVAGFRVADAETNVAKQLSMVNEITQWNNSIWGLFPDDLWLSSPGSIARADRKLIQLLTAREVGFEIPRSMVANDWSVLEEGLLRGGRTMIVKMLRGVLADQNHLKGLYTTPLDQAAVDRIRNETVPFPGLYQPFVDKAREWRVTVVGDQVFSVAIYTNAEAKDDWRRMQLTSAVRFARENLPADVEEKCKTYLRHFSLRYGAFDLIESDDGRIVFLECNPNGQHNWLEQAVGIPVADALAAELAKIAERD
ncbi:hypothetical protein ACN24L_00170 [Streptomyces microflavus]